MNNIVTEKDYPIQLIWVFKSAITGILTLIFLFFYSHDFFRNGRSIDSLDSILSIIPILLLLVFLLVPLFLSFLNRINFHYALEYKFLVIRQGILSKQQRHIPYGVIQNIFVKQDLFDRVLNITSLTLENASASKENIPQFDKFITKIFAQRQQTETIGSTNNRVVIPGLTKQNAETLKALILEKMKANPVDTIASGL